MAELRQQMFLRAVGVTASAANVATAVTLERLSDRPAHPSELALTCATLFTTASTPDSNFFATNTTTCGVLYEISIRRMSS